MYDLFSIVPFKLLASNVRGEIHPINLNHVNSYKYYTLLPTPWTVRLLKNSRDTIQLDCKYISASFIDDIHFVCVLVHHLFDCI